MEQTHFCGMKVGGLWWENILKMTVFWHAAPCILVQVNRSFRGVYCLHHQGDEENVGKFLPDYTAQHPRRQSSSDLPPWEHEISDADLVMHCESSGRVSFVICVRPVSIYHYVCSTEILLFMPPLLTTLYGVVHGSNMLICISSNSNSLSPWRKPDTIGVYFGTYRTHFRSNGLHTFWHNKIPFY
jgi:hypothetical protein